MIRFEQITKHFGPVLALDNVSCEVQPGTVHAFLGENGAGKTTLMRVLAGVTKPDSGQLVVDEREHRLGNVRSARRLGIGMVHQHFSLHPSLTALENVAIASGNGLLFRARGLASQMTKLSQETGLMVDPRALVADLSYADRPRLEILRLLLWGARTIILDEPTSVLSGDEARRVLAQMQTLARTGRSILLVTHKLREVQEFADVVTVCTPARTCCCNGPACSSR